MLDLIDEFRNIGKLFFISNTLNKIYPNFLAINIFLKVEYVDFNGKLMIFTQSEGLGSVPYLRGAPFPDGAESEYPLYSAAVIPMKDADFSYDGFWIALESWPDGVMHDIYIMAFNGAELTQITFDSGLDFDPAWRPITP